MKNQTITKDRFLGIGVVVFAPFALYVLWHIGYIVGLSFWGE